MQYLKDEELPEESFFSISQEMLEKMTQNSWDEFSDEISEEKSWNLAWGNFGQTLQAAADFAFQKPVDAQKILAKIAKNEIVVPEKKVSLAPTYRFLNFSKWLGAAILCVGMIFVGTTWYFAPIDEHVTSVDDSWDPISEEIDDLAFTLDNLEQKCRSSLDMELALVSTRLDTIYDTFLDDEWEEDYF